MDYCYACRRHLNGALACAGCGAPADEPVRPVATGPVDHEFDRREEDPPAVHRRARKRPAGRARRARRRSGRRTALLATLGVALAAGALSLAELATEAPQDGSAASVKEAARPTEPPGPGATDGDGPRRPSAVPAAERSVTGKPTGSSGPGAGTSVAAASASASASASPGPGGTASPGAPQPSSASHVPSPPGRSDSPGEPSPTPPPATQPPPPPQPTPTPTRTCTRFLWWCT